MAASGPITIVINTTKQAVNWVTTFFTAIFNVLSTLTGVAVVALIAIGLVLFSQFYYHDHVNDVMSVVERTYRCNVYPLLKQAVDSLLRGLVQALEWAIDKWNFLGVLARDLGNNLFVDIVLNTDGIFPLVRQVFYGIGHTIAMVCRWLFIDLLERHMPFYSIYTELVANVVDRVVVVAHNLCDVMGPAFDMVNEVIQSDHLRCALHNIINGVIQTVIEFVKLGLVTVWRLLTYLFGGWDPYIPQLRNAEYTLRIGVAHLGRFVGDLIRMVGCRLFSLVQSTVETTCTNECHVSCSRSCLLNYTSDYTECMALCFTPCLLTCHEEHMNDDYDTCVDTLYVADYVSDLIASLLHGAIATAFEVANGAVQFINDASVVGLGNANFEPLWDSLRDPRYWYDRGGHYDLTPYTRASAMYLDAQLENATTSCADDASYNITDVTCSECAYVLKAGDPHRILPFATVLCQLGGDIDTWIGIDEEYPIFQFLLCRIVGTAVRLAVSAARWGVGLVQALLRDGFLGFFLFLGYEPNFANTCPLYGVCDVNTKMMADLHCDLLYTCETVGLIIPTLAADDKLYPLETIVANPLKIAVEAVMIVYRFLARTINEIIKAIDGIDRNPQNYFYLLQFFCTHSYCINWHDIFDLIIIPDTPNNVVGLVEYYNATCVNGYIEGTTQRCTHSPILWFRVKTCPALQDKWDYRDNPNGRRAFAEALCWLVNFDDFLDAFGLPFVLPDLCCALYDAIRVVCNVAYTALQALFGFMDIEKFLWCKDPTHVTCAPIGNIVCDTGAIIECPCDVFRLLGLPDCFCTFFHAFGQLIRMVMGFLWAIFDAVDNPDWRTAISTITNAFRLLLGVEVESPLYELSEASTCMFAIFFGRNVDGSYRDFCTSGQDHHISTILHAFLLNVLNIVAYAAGIVADLVDTIVGAVSGEAEGEVRSFIQNLLNGAFHIIFGLRTVDNSSPLRVGILGSLGNLISCIFGPPASANNGIPCDYDYMDSDRRPCMGTFITMISRKLAGVAEVIVDIIMDWYDIFADLFQGKWPELGNAVVSFLTHLVDLLAALGSLLWDVMWGFIRGIAVWIFGDGVGNFITWLKDGTGAFIDGCIGFLCAFNVFPSGSTICTVHFGPNFGTTPTPEPTPSAPMLAKGGVTEASASFFDKLARAYDRKVVGGRFQAAHHHRRLRTGESNGFSYSMTDLVAAIREYPEQFLAFFDNNPLCYSHVERIANDQKYVLSIADEYPIRGCFAAVVQGYEYSSYNPDAYSPDFFSNPEHLFTSLRQAVTGLAEYATYAVNGDSYFDKWRRPSGLRSASTSCVTGQAMNESDPSTLACLLTMNGVTKPFARFVTTALYNKLSTVGRQSHTPDVKRDFRLRLATPRHSAPLVHMEAAVDTLAAHLPPIDEPYASRARRTDLVASFTERALSQATGTAKAVMSYLYEATGRVTVPKKDRQPPTGFLDFGVRVVQGVTHVFGKHGWRAYNRTATAFSTLKAKLASLPRNTGTYYAYQTRVKLRGTLAGLYYRFPSLRPVSAREGGLRGSVFGAVHRGLSSIECDRSKAWCRAALDRDAQLLRTQDDWFVRLLSDSPPALTATSGVGTEIPSLNCYVVDRILAEIVGDVDEYFVAPVTYQCGQYSSNWLQWVPATDNTSLVLPANGTLAAALKWFTTAEVPHDTDVIETAITFAQNVNDDPQQGPVGLLFYARGLIPEIPLFSRCYYDTAARGYFGVGLWRSLGITLWVWLLIAALLFILFVLKKDWSPSSMWQAGFVMGTLIVVALHLTGFIAYGWSVHCLGSPDSLLTLAVGIPSLPIIPKCLPGDLTIGLNYTVDHPRLEVPTTALVDPEQDYLASCSLRPEYKKADEVGFHDWTGTFRFLLATTLPPLWRWLNTSALLRPLFVGDYGNDFMAYSEALRSTQWWYFGFLVPEMLGVLLIIVLVIVILVEAWQLVNLVATTAVGAGAALYRHLAPDPAGADPAVAVQSV